MSKVTKSGVLQSLTQGIEVLKLLAVSGPMRNMDLAEQTGLSRPTISRIVQTLKLVGLVDQSSNQGAAHLSIGAATLGSAYILQSRYLQVAIPLMSTFSRQTDCTVMIMAYDGLSGKCIYLDGVEVESLQDHPGDIGMLFHPMESVTGRVIVGNMRLSERQILFKKWQSDYPQEVWRELIVKFDKDMESLSDKGYCVGLSERFRSLNAVALPLDVEGGVALSLACTAPVSTLSPERIEQEIGGELVVLARKIETRLAQKVVS